MLLKPFVSLIGRLPYTNDDIYQYQSSSYTQPFTRSQSVVNYGSTILQPKQRANTLPFEKMEQMNLYGSNNQGNFFDRDIFLKITVELS